MQPQTLSAEEAPLLQDLETENWHPPADVGLRFVNLLLDMIGYYGLATIVGLLIGTYSAVTNTTDAVESVEGLTSGLGGAALSYLIYITYYTIIEGITKGRSLGKFATGTKVVREDGAPFTWGNAFMRSICRIVPFEAFSAFGGHPWHDKWTKTKVIKKPK